MIKKERTSKETKEKDRALLLLRKLSDSHYRGDVGTEGDGLASKTESHLREVSRKKIRRLANTIAKKFRRTS